MYLAECRSEPVWNGRTDCRPTALRRARQADNYRADGLWQLTDQNTIHVSWSTGLQGIRATLRRGSTRTSGGGGGRIHSRMAGLAPSRH